MTSSRCHGPGCRNQVAGVFCSAACLTTWEAQFDGSLAGPGPLVLPLAPFTAAERLSGVVRPSIQDPAESLVRVEPFGDEGDSLGAAFPQVASKTPQVERGWLQRLFDRWRRES